MIVFRSVPRLFRLSTSRGFQTSGPVSELKSIQEIREKLQSTLGATSAWRKNEEIRRQLAEALPKQQDQLTPRFMKDSYCEAKVPLTDKRIREKYRGLSDNAQFGLLLENLDSFAVHISYLHNSPSGHDDGGSPFSIVTAMVDEIKLHNNKFTLDDDIRMKGHVCWVGKSSMEIKMWMTQGDRPMVDATFVMVARDPCNKSAVVHPLQIANADEQKDFEEGEKRKVKRLQEAKHSLLKHPPNEEERKVVHDLFIQTIATDMSFDRNLPENCVWMEDTKLKNMIICFPQKRNIHNKIFGGFIMRKGFEHAWASGCVYAKTMPVIKAVDDVLFRSPVPIGSLLLMSSHVCFSYENKFHIRVHAVVSDPMTGKQTTCNTFNFSFECDHEVPTVVPRSYGQSMLYLDGRRRYPGLNGS